MLRMVMSVYRAFEEGLAYAKIASRYESDPAEMAERIRAALAARYEAAPAPVTMIRPAEAEGVEMAAA